MSSPHYIQFIVKDSEWQSSEGFFSKKSPEKMKRDELIKELKKYKIEFKNEESDVDLRNKVKERRKSSSFLSKAKNGLKIIKKGLSKIKKGGKVIISGTRKISSFGLNW
jgi:hypothetical protein